MADELKINGSPIAVFPTEMTVTVLDIDGESNRSADGTLNRDRVAVKRQIEMGFGLLKWPEIGALLQSMANIYFDVYYPDPMAFGYLTKTFYVGNRSCPVAVFQHGSWQWKGLKITLTER
jgi:hypothetical protein